MSAGDSVSAGAACQDRSADAPRSPSRVMQVVEALAEVPAGLTLSELCERLTIPKTSLHSQLKALLASGHLAQEASRYRLGPAALRLGSIIAATSSLLTASRPALRELVDETRESALLAVVDAPAGQAVYIERHEGLQPVRYSPQVGVRRPLYCTAFGRALLAFQPDDYVARYLGPHDHPAITRHTVTAPGDLHRLVQLVRKTGVATTAEEHTLHAAAIAAPVFDASDAPVAAIGIALPADRLRARRREFAERVITAARGVSWTLGAALPARPAG